jgi:hypothetical protein
MRLLLSIPLALFGGTLGSVLRQGLRFAEQRLDADPGEPPLQLTTTITASPAAAIAGGALGLLLGPRTAFWSGVALGAAGVERFDARLLGLVGVDLDVLIARVTAGAPEAAADDSSESPAAEPA